MIAAIHTQLRPGRKAEAVLDHYEADWLGLNCIRRPNFEKLRPPLDGRLDAYTAFVEFQDQGLFGNEQDYLAEVHPRLQAFTRQLSAAFAEDDPRFNPEIGTASLCVYPVRGRARAGTLRVEKENRHSWGRDILPIDQIAANSAYYAELNGRYEIRYGIVTNNGTVIGPDGGILAATRAVALSFSGKVRVLELGAGGGSTAFSLMAIDKLESYRGIDFSPQVQEHFHRQVLPLFHTRKVQGTIVNGSCFDIELGESVDVVVVGVYYQAQPELMRRSGHALRQATGAEGVLVFQTGMLEDRFVTDLLTRNPREFNGWPWYTEQYWLGSYFRYSAVVETEGEVIVLATSSRNRLARTIEQFPEERALITINAYA